MYPNLETLLIKVAQEAGFPLAGSIDLDLAFSDPQQTFQAHVDHYDHWIKKGHQGAMDYLVRGRDRRADPRLLFPKAQSMLCVAWPYPKLQGPSEGAEYARYLKEGDYHTELSTRLEALMQAVKQEIKQDIPELEWKICVDTSAVLERTWASLAGLGWIGKNSVLINPKYGSYLFLAEVLINVKTGMGPRPLPSYCGNCTRCLDSCPTQAFEGPGVLNSNRCVSYWTLEKRGPLDLSPDDLGKIGKRIAGCDRCQEVCPFNFKPVKEELARQEVSDEATLPSAVDLNRWSDLVRESEEDYKKRIKDSALKRVKPAQFRRNLSIALRNALEEEVHVYRSYSSAEPPTEIDPSEFHLLSDEEKERYKSFLFEKDRYRFLVARLLVRKTLARYLDCAPQEIQFGKGPYGRPFISSPVTGLEPNLHFSLSHTDGLAVLAISRWESIGVDVEKVTRKASCLQLAKRFFSPVEYEDLRVLEGDALALRFFEYWTLKESYIKARGMGLALPLHQFSFQCRPIKVTFDPELKDNAAEWQFFSEKMNADFQLALAVKSPPGKNSSTPLLFRIY